MPRLSKIGAAALAAFGWTSGGAAGVTASYLVVAGGGGGNSDSSGGGGAGGLLTGTASLNGTNTYTVTVGAGGPYATNGSNSVLSGTGISTVTTTGGGCGSGAVTGYVPGNGGSGGGGSGGGGSSSGTGIAGQGFAGGNGAYGASPNYPGGGGGGAGAVGASVSGGGGNGGNGGIGVSSSISGTATYYAGGGGGNGGLGTRGVGGLGGGGNGGDVSNPAGATNGTPNTGGGAGGGNYLYNTTGGSGVVIVSYPAPQLFWGGSVTTSGGNIIHTFTTSGSLEPIGATVSANYLIVAGGGGGGCPSGGGGGGGGAGGYRTSTTTLTLSSSYTVTVGAGGTGAIALSGANGVVGSNSVFNSITSAGGGFGAGYTTGSAGNGGSGGSGGGSAGNNPTTSGGAGNTPSTSPSQGSNGGGASSIAFGTGGGGGGGATSSGTTATTTSGANGGNGTASSITVSSVTYAGVGGGGSDARSSSTGGTGGTGGGGTGGGGSSAVAGTANLGGGGGGGQTDGSGNAQAGGNGGAGVVIISYAGSTQLFGGGVVTFAGGNTIHTFNTSGTLTPVVSLSASYLIVAGGGGGGADGSGGGGAGGLLSGSGVIIDTSSTYLVTVGAGGASVSGGASNGNAGSNSSFSIVPTVAVGGGRGASYSQNGGSGGSGGGGGGLSSQAGGAGTSGQGNAGGSGNTGSYYYGGGGGGAGAAGSNASTGGGGNGGVGLASTITGSSVYYAGGGGGAGDSRSGSNGSGGNGGGGNANSSSAGASGSANTGGGGGAGGFSVDVSGAGGSGIVVISYAGSTQLMAGGTVTISGGNVIHTFNNSGYLSPLTFVGNSLRFRASASAYLARTPTVASNRQTWTFSAWVKRGALGSTQMLLSAGPAQPTTDALLSLRFESTDALRVVMYESGTGKELTSSSLYRDPAAWYHIVMVLDTTNATSSNRIRFYVNGVQLTAFSTANYPTQNYSFGVNNTQTHNIARYYYDTVSSPSYFDGEMTEVRLIDGQALTPNSFGTFNSYGVWQPITYGGSYGTNGFYLPFNRNTTSAYAGVFAGANYISSNYSFNWATGGNFTMEAWVCPSAFSSTINMIGGTSHAQNDGYSVFYYYTDGKIAFGINGTNEFTTSAGTVKAGNWYHIALVSVSSFLTIYVNGKSVRSINGSAYLSNNSATMWMGGNATSTQGVIGNISNFRFVTSAVYTDNFTPPTTDLTAITGTQLLTFQNSSIVDNSGNSRTLTNNGSVTTSIQYPNNLTFFNDQGPAGNNWTPNNLSLSLGSNYDSMTDVPTLTSATAANYAVLNPLNKGSIISLTNGNLNATSSSGTYGTVLATIGSASGKYYWEVLINSSAVANAVGIGTASTDISTYIGKGASLGYANTGIIYGPNDTTTQSGLATFTINDIIGVALNLDSSEVKFYKNNTLVTTVTSLTATTWFPAISDFSSVTDLNVTINFGQQPFVYTPPSGFVALNTYNL